MTKSTGTIQPDASKAALNNPAIKKDVPAQTIVPAKTGKPLPLQGNEAGKALGGAAKPTTKHGS